MDVLVAVQVVGLFIQVGLCMRVVLVLLDQKFVNRCEEVMVVVSGSVFLVKVLDMVMILGIMLVFLQVNMVLRCLKLVMILLRMRGSLNWLQIFFRQVNVFGVWNFMLLVFWISGLVMIFVILVFCVEMSVLKVLWVFLLCGNVVINCCCKLLVNRLCIFFFGLYIDMVVRVFL